MTQAEDAGSIDVKIRVKLDEMEKGLLQSQKRIDYYARQFEKQGEKGGKVYVQGFGASQVMINQQLNNMVANMQGLSPRMGAVGEKLAGVFSKPIFTMAPMVGMAFSSMLGAVGAVIMAVQALWGWVSKAFDAYAEQQKLAKNAQEAAQRLTGTYTELTEIQKRYNEIEEYHSKWYSWFAFWKTREGDKQKAKAEEINKANENINKTLSEQAGRLKLINEQHKQGITSSEERNRALLSHYEQELEALVQLRLETETQVGQSERQTVQLIRGIDARIAKTKELMAEQNKKAEEDNERLKTEELHEKLKQEMTDLSAASARARNNYDNAAAADKQARLNEYLNLLKKEVDFYDEMIEKYSYFIDSPDIFSEEADEKMRRLLRLFAQITAGLKESAEAHGVALDSLERQSEAQERDAAIRKAMAEAEAAYNHDARTAEKLKLKGLIDEEEKQSRITQAHENKLAAVEQILKTYKLTSGAAWEEYTALKAAVDKRNEEKKLADAREKGKKDLEKYELQLGDQLLQQEAQKHRAAAALAETDQERLWNLNEALELEKRLIREQRKREWAATEELGWVKALKEADAERYNEIKAKFDQITKQRQDALEKAEKEPSLWEAFFGSVGFESFMQTGDAAISAFETISGTILEIARKRAEETVKTIEETLSTALEGIRKLREQELEEKKFAEASSEEEIQKQIDRAKAANDEVLQYRLERRKEEAAINKKYDDMAKKAEEKAANDKAAIEHKTAMQEYGVQMIKAVNAGIMAVLQALSSGPPPANIILAGISGGAAAVQIGLLAANPPQPPKPVKLSSGGIVPGNSFTGDKVPGLLNSREGVFTLRDQEYLFDIVQNRKLGTETEGRVTKLTVIMNLDGRQIAQSSADVYGSGQVTIPARGVASR